ncbi:MAG: hypothetical protein JWM46_722 [Candidatus Kaiserbacteria bacterium]|nr:hypothetical protein [Candidatus Kaiserbacteria bacterium]
MNFLPHKKFSRQKIKKSYVAHAFNNTVPLTNLISNQYPPRGKRALLFTYSVAQYIFCDT